MTKEGVADKSATLRGKKAFSLMFEKILWIKKGPRNSFVSFWGESARGTEWILPIITCPLDKKRKLDNYLSATPAE